MSADTAVTHNEQMLASIQDVIRKHLPAQAGEVLGGILADKAVLESRIAALETRLEEATGEAAEIAEAHAEALGDRDETIRSQMAEMGKLTDKVEELKDWELRAERIAQAERELATKILQVKLEEAERRATELKELAQQFAGRGGR